MTTDPAPLIPKVSLGRTGIVSTKLGLGTASWPRRVPFEQVVEMLQTALDAGIRHIDTAPKYLTEEVVGRALQELDLPDDIVYATKAGCYSDPEIGVTYVAYRASQIYRSVERSLKRLGTDHIHILHVHDVVTERIGEVFRKGGAIEALVDLKEQGVIGAVGMGTLGLEPLQAAVDSDLVDVLQIFHNYTLLNQSAAEHLIPSALAKGISILNSAPYAGYILATGAVEGAKYNYAPAPPEVLAATRRLQAVCEAKGVDLPTAATAFSLRSPDIDVTVPASGKPKRVAQWIAAMNAPLTDADFAELLEAAGGQYALRR